MTETGGDDPPDAAELAFPLLPDSPHAAEAAAAGRPVRFHLVTMLGLGAEEVERLLPTTDAVMRAEGLTPVYVTDLLDYRVFREAGVLFEPLPPLGGSALLAPDLDWRARRRRVFRLIRARWQPSGVAVLGRELEQGA